MTHRFTFAFAPLLAGLLASTVLTGCAGDTGISLPNPATTTQATAAENAPVSLTRAGSSDTQQGGSALRSVNKGIITRAVERYRVNAGGKDATYQIAGADLDSDGTAEALVYLSGVDWCAATGCTLLVMRKTTTGYNVISLVKRVQLPVGVSPRASQGWRDLMMATGPASSPRLVTLEFDGNRYPGNASTLPPAPAGIAARPEIALRRQQPATNLAATVPQSGLGSSTTGSISSPVKRVD